MMAKKCTKKHDAHACKVVVFLIYPIAFLLFLLPLPSVSSLLKLPINSGVWAK